MTKVTVDYNAGTLSQFFTPAFIKYPQLKAQLLSDFRLYKEQCARSVLFGRDVQFDFPAQYRDSQVWHIHLDLSGNDFNGQRRQFKRTSNDYLIYTFGFSDEYHLSLLAVISPDAHKKMSGQDTR